MKTLARFMTLRAMSHALTILLVIALGWQVAGWAWQFLSAENLAPPSDMQVATRPADVAAKPWFGIPDGSKATGIKAANSSSQTEPGGLRLAGTLAGGKSPQALISQGGAPPQTYVQGETLSDGTRLQTVAANHVIVIRNGVAERLEMHVKAPLPGQAKDGAKP